jgi:hypothetical protein
VPAPRKFSDEMRQRAKRMVREARVQEPGLSVNAACKRIGPQLGILPDTLSPCRPAATNARISSATAASRSGSVTSSASSVATASPGRPAFSSAAPYRSAADARNSVSRATSGCNAGWSSSANGRPQGQCPGVPVRIVPGRGELVGEGRDVDRGAVCHELIPVDRGDDARPGRKHPTQPGDRRVQRACGIAGGTFPHQLTEQVGANHLTGVRCQRDEQPPLPGGADEDGAGRADDLQRPEHAHHRHPDMVTVPRRRGHRITQARPWDGAADRPGRQTRAGQFV